MRVRVATTAFSLIVILAMGSPTSRASPAIARSNVVVYDRGGEIFAANVDGSGERNLTRGRALHAGDPDVSSDGTMIVFSVYLGPSGYRVMVMNVDGSGLHQIGRVHGGQPAAQWSPDGSLVAYGGAPQGILDVVAPDGSGLRNIATDNHGYGFSWSPNGREIVYGGEDTLQAVSVASGGRRTIAQARVWDVTWSPDGSKIAFTTSASGQNVWIVRQDGAPARNVFFAEGGTDTPKWSPDSKAIAFGAEPGSGAHARVFALNVATGVGTAVTTPEFREGSHSPSWSPDGLRLVYERERIGRSPHSETDVWLMNADGTAKLQLTSAFPSGSDTSAPEWVPGLGRVEPDADAGRAVAARPNRVAELAVPAEKLEADQTRAVFPSGGLRVWSAQTGRIRLQRGDCENLVDLAIAGRRVAWTCEEQFLSSCAATLKTATVAQSRPIDVVNLKYCELSVAARGSLVVYSTGRKIWRLEGSRKRLVRIEPIVARPLSVDGGRVLLQRRSGSLEVVTAGGVSIRVMRFTSRPSTAELAGERVVVLQREKDSVRLQVIRLRDGKFIHSWPLPAYDTLELESVYGSLAVYVVGIALHVMNLENGHDVVLMFPQQAGETHARLVARGLFYSHGRAYAARAGQVGFIPRSRLVELLR
jgi:Tol biopolymer transport system component